MFELSRRKFFLTLVSSVIAAKCPLPIGFPEEPAEVLPQGTYEMVILDIETRNNEMITATVLIEDRTFNWIISRGV